MVSTKANRIAIFVTMIMSILLIIGCQQADSKNDDEAGRVIGSIHGIVSDANTNARLADIVVTVIDNGNTVTVTTDTLGYYAIRNLSSGNFDVTFSGDSAYAISRTTVYIPLISQIVGTPEWPDGDFQEDFFYSENADMNLFALNSSITGTVYTVEDSENTSMASNVTLIADFSAYDISPDKYTASSNSQGVYTFSDLPSAPSTTIRSMPFNDGTFNYNVQATNVALVPDGTASAGVMLLTIGGDAPFIVQNNFENNDFEIGDDITITFSKAMLASSFEISLTGAGGDVGVDASWDSDVALIISPYVNYLQANTNYTLDLFGYSLDNNLFSQSLNFNTQDGIEFVHTNLEMVDGIFNNFAVNNNIEINFTMPIDLDNYNGYVTLTDESSAQVSTVETLSNGSMTLVINPLYNLEPGQTYGLVYRVYSNIEGDFDMGSFNFSTAADVSLPGQVTGFAVTMGDNWEADWTTTFITFEWDNDPDADSYSIYANDNAANSDFIRIGSYGAQDFVLSQSGSINLNSYPQFDLFDDDGIQTPFSDGTELTFKILAENTAGEGAFSAGIVVSDGTPPTGSMNQSGTALNNSTTDSQTFTINFSTSEYLDGSDPGYSIIENGGDANYVIPNSAVAYEWDADLRGGVFTITVPPNSDGRGDLFLVSQVIDNSNNALDGSISIVLN